jgi:hypothetical protein
VADVDPDASRLGDGAGDDRRGLVGRVVEHLDLEAITRIVERADGFDDATAHVELVVDRDLHRDHREVPIGERSRCGGGAGRRHTRNEKDSRFIPNPKSANDSAT